MKPNDHEPENVEDAALNQAAQQSATESEAPAESQKGMQALTLASARLAGSAACLNCGTPLKGPFCYYCGQPDRNFLRFFPALLREFMADFLELDSRFMRTLKPLLFKPGRLTRDYLEGRRFRYTPPLRLYLFSSIAFFLLASLLSVNAIDMSNEDGDFRFGTGIEFDRDQLADELRVQNLSADEVAEVMAKIDAANQAVEKAKALAADPAPEASADLAGSEASGDGTASGSGDAATEPPTDTTKSTKQNQITINGEAWDRETNPFEISWMPAFVNEWINDEIEESPKKGEEISKNPNLILNQVFDILPATMFVLLPVVALLFRFWYLFARRYYIEHLIFALHNHAFIFVSLIVALLLGLADTLMLARGWSFGADLANWVEAAIGIWIPVYLLLSLRHVYQQNWWLTVAKFGVIGISYMMLLGLTTTVVAVLSFVLL